MKKIVSLILILLLSVTIGGCGSKPTAEQPANSPPSAQENKTAEKSGTSPAAQSSTPAVSTNTAVPLLDDFPKEVPLVDGVIWGCKKLEIKDQNQNPTGNHLFRVNIDTKLGSVSEVYDYYKSKFTEVTKKGYVENSMAEIEGLAGDWNVAVLAGKNSKEGPVEVTLVVRHKSTIKKGNI